ncbi:MAG: hypothetical protein JSW28_02640 [Thermoplasmata archaeon]|nr:MAG: hypothetical protein JSW28_02640 [Thermoplasmata archaeon]
MKDYDAIRGKKPTKTENILEYMVDHPNEVLSPKKVADELGFNLQTTVTVLNRLAMEGAISKEARGQFCYHSKEKAEKKEVKGAEKEREDFAGPSLDKKNAPIIYKAIYHMASESTGPDILKTITGLGPDDFDDKAPIESIKNLIAGLIDVLGEEMAVDIVSIALQSELKPKKDTNLKQLMESWEDLLWKEMSRS